MIKQRLIIQGITENNHLNELKWLLAIPNPTEIIISTAFMRASGLALIEEQVSSLKKKPKVFVGIRNGITTAQAVEKCLEMGCDTYTIDTGSSIIIFHPKIYLSSNAQEMRLIIGSANLTVGGLNGNIEASVCMNLDLSVKENRDLLDDAHKKLQDMIPDFPEHVTKITKKSQIKEMFAAGRLADEAVKIVMAPVGKSKNRELDTISRIKLKTQTIPRKAATKAVAAKGTENTALPVVAVGGGRTLLWVGSPLTRRDLTIPDNENSNPTGSTLLKKGNSDIDQQTYFRDEVFNHLKWAKDTKTEGKELADAHFQLIVKSVDYGIHKLTLSHDTRTNTASYKQKQPMTSLRWGEARSIVAKEDLLERTISLYKSDVAGDLFIIEIE